VFRPCLVIPVFYYTLNSGQIKDESGNLQLQAVENTHIIKKGCVFWEEERVHGRQAITEK
jgi:hypothetical protein